jgi:prepilin-type N-terminal cleavage/methylation domain-containing protein
MDKCNKKGFTLIELIVVIAILGVLAGVLVPMISSYIKDANLSVAKSNGATVLEVCMRISAESANGGEAVLSAAAVYQSSGLHVLEGAYGIDDSVVVNIINRYLATLWSMKGGQLAMWTPDRGWVYGQENVPFEEDEFGELSFGLANGNTAYVIKDGRNFSKSILSFPASYKGLPVIGVANSAFNNCKALNSVTFATSYDFIGVSTFNGCTSLTSVRIASSVTNVGNNAFNGCSSLMNVYVERSQTDNITVGGTNMFIGCPTGMSIYVPADSLTAYRTAEGWQKDATKIKSA